MKSCDEMINSLLERRGRYVAAQKKKRKTLVRITSVVCSFVLVALLGVGVWQTGWLGSDKPPIVEDPVADPSGGPGADHSQHEDASTTTTSSTTQENPGTGGDSGSCEEHQFFYHAITGNWTNEEFKTFREEYEDTPEEFNIISFVQYHEITREEYIERMNWEDILDQKAVYHYEYCPYTYNQYLDAIYGDDPELAEWVFSQEVIWNAHIEWMESQK